MAESGAELIAAERLRQVEAEGWTTEHDTEHDSFELTRAAVAYCFAARVPHYTVVPAEWPWEHDWWKPSGDPVRNLVKAGALIAAEIDRLQALDRP